MTTNTVSTVQLSHCPLFPSSDCHCHCHLSFLSGPQVLAELYSAMKIFPMKKEGAILSTHHHCYPARSLLIAKCM